jgi:hypothetical protein
MPARSLPDLFDGTFDNTATGRREIWQDGRLCRFARRNAVGTDETHWRELHAPWGAFPDYPGNASQPLKES